MSVSVSNTARHSTPRVPFLQMKNKVLRKSYELSVVFIPPQKMKALNKQYRKKDSSTDILAFPLSKNNGEIYLCMQDVKRKAPEFGMTTPDYLRFLFVHGMLHLEGHDHGKAMEALEQKFCKLLRIKAPY